LEEIRLLTNLETVDQKLLQILLVGQPELDLKLDSPNLCQLKQRIAWRSHLNPLNNEEICGYIQRRMRVAGANSHAPSVFPNETVSAIYKHSRGIPRLINTVCENALIMAYAKQSCIVTPAIVDEVAHDLRLGVVTTSTESTKLEKDKELRQAVMTLLHFSEALQVARAHEKRIEVPITIGAELDE
jgi:general secretion pathway protein A